MKILLVHGDDVPWATENRANELKKRWVDDEVDIVEWHKVPDANSYDVIHVLFSGGISQLKEFISKYRDKTFTTLASQRTLDCVYDSQNDLRDIYRMSKGIVVQNPTLLCNLIAIIGNEHSKKTHYITNGVDERKFNKEFVVGYVGTDQAYHKEYKGFHLVEQACKELGLTLKRTHNAYPDSVIPHDKMPDFYKDIDCLVIPSMGEGCNNPTLEALAMNIPVISTRVGIAEELDGVILVERNVDAIKSALRKLSGRIQILEKYTWDIIARRYHELYVSNDRFEYIRTKEKDAYLNIDSRSSEMISFVGNKINTLDFKKSLDLGCGKINFPFRNCTRVDGNIDCKPEKLMDLAEVHDFSGYQMIISIEVAEHIEPEYAENFVNNITQSEKWIVMTAAPIEEEHFKSPYSKIAHLNERPKEYWINLIESKGFRYKKELTDEWQDYFKRYIDIPKWFKEDLMIYEKAQ